MINKNTLPEGWELARLGNIAKVKGGKRLPKGALYSEEKTSYPYLRVTDFENQTINNAKLKYLTPEIQQAIKNYTISKNDVFISIAGTIGVTGTIPENLDGANLTENAAKITDLINVHKKYLSLFLGSHIGQLQIKQFTKTTTQPKLSLYRIEEIQLPLPPLSEQQEIVAKIEELLSELDQGKQQLETARRQLKVYRQAVLKWAFEGKLTNDLDNLKEGELPKGWKYVELGQLMDSVRNGYSKKPDTEGNFKILRISSVRPGKVDLTDVRRLINEIGEENSVQENDLLFTRYNGSIDYVGVCGRITKLNEKIFYPDKLIRCRPKIKEPFHSAYLEYASNSGNARRFVLSKIKTTAGQTGIAGSEIKQLPIPLAPLEEQNQIVQEIESRLSVCDKVEETITQSLQNSETLRQSILKQAFEGKLVNFGKTVIEMA